MNRTVPPGNCRDRSRDFRRQSGCLRVDARPCGLARRASDPSKRETPPERFQAARERWNGRLSFDGITALAVLTLDGYYVQTHLLAHCTRQEATYRMRLPTRGLHQFLDS